MGGSQRAGADGNPLVPLLPLPLPPAAPGRLPVCPSLSESVDSSSSADDVDPPEAVSSLPLDLDLEILEEFFDADDDDSDLIEFGGDLPLPVIQYKQSQP